MTSRDSPTLDTPKRARTTVYIPVDLLEAADKITRQGKAASRNDLVIAGLWHMIRRLEREAIDSDFAGMATDSTYLAEANEIAEEFRPAGWEALQIAEGSRH